MTVQTGIRGVEPGVRNSLPARAITEEDSGSLQSSPPLEDERLSLG